jgi:hypothetical protein
MIELQRELALLSSTTTMPTTSATTVSDPKCTSGSVPLLAVDHKQDNNNIIYSKNANLLRGHDPSLPSQSNSVGSNEIFKTASVLSPTDDTIAFVLPDNKRRARALYDYDALNSKQLSVQANEVVIVTLNESADADFVLAERGSQRGQVPVAYLEILK